MQYPLADLLSQLPVLFHRETKKLQHLKGTRIEVHCKKYPSATQNEEAAWPVVAGLVDMVAVRVLPVTMTKGKPKVFKARVQELYIPQFPRNANINLQPDLLWRKRLEKKKHFHGRVLDLRRSREGEESEDCPC